MDGYLDMISRKTGALIRTPMHVGAIMGTHDQAVIESFRECGRSLGYVFRYATTFSVSGVRRRPQASLSAPMFARKKNSLPIVHAMSQADRVQKQALEHVYEKVNVEDADVETVLDIMDSLGTEAFANSLAASTANEVLNGWQASRYPRTLALILKNCRPFFSSVSIRGSSRQS